MAIIDAINGDQIDSVKDLSWCIRALLRDACGHSVQIEPAEGFRDIDHQPAEFLVSVRCGSKTFKVGLEEVVD